MRTYDPKILPQVDPRDLTWARTWVRSLLRDMPEIQHAGLSLGSPQPERPVQATWPEFSREDEQINTALRLDAVSARPGQCSSQTYYRPHVTAARLYIGDPALWQTRSVDGTSETRRSPEAIAAAWLAQGAMIDALIPLPLPEVNLGGGVSLKPERLKSTYVYAPGGW